MLQGTGRRLAPLLSSVDTSHELAAPGGTAGEDGRSGSDEDGELEPQGALPTAGNHAAIASIGIGSTGGVSQRTG